MRFPWAATSPDHERNPMRTRGVIWLGCVAALAAVTAALVPARADDLNPKVKEAEAKRIAAIEKVKPSVVAIFSPGGQGGGSGVLIDDQGYVLTNFHVVAGSGPVMQCGLSDGILYDGVVVGIDKVGDVAMVKLLPKKEGNKFPFAKMGDSDKLKAGDWSLAMGNPFLLATDFNPTVTFGLISGVHRYQYPEGGLLEYTDCIQIDTSINPGNSGGPLFNLDGELVGINGRGSFEKRGRVNSGVGYAISINQIKNFLGHLRAGLDADHATLGALVESENDEGALGRLKVKTILSDCDAARRGLDVDDELVSFGGRPLGTVNQYKNILGIFPRGWRMPVVFKHENEQKQVEKVEALVRLMGAQRQEIKNPDDKGDQPPPGQPMQPIPNSPAAKLYEAKPGYANYYFNKLERDRLMNAFRTKYADLTKAPKEWVLEMEGEIGQRNGGATVTLTEEKDGTSMVRSIIRGVTIDLEPLKKRSTDAELEELRVPKGSGGMLLALWELQQLLATGDKAFASGFSHGGVEPFYPPTNDPKPDYKKQRIDCEVIRTEQAGISTKFYFGVADGELKGLEVSVSREDDPCEMYFSKYEKTDDGKYVLPKVIEVRYGGGDEKDSKRYALLNVKSYKFHAPGEGKAPGDDK
jgi:serine protease Do